MAQWPEPPNLGVPRAPDGKPKTYRPPRHDPPEMASLTWSGVWRTGEVICLRRAGISRPEDIQPWAAAALQTTCR